MSNIKSWHFGLGAVIIQAIFVGYWYLSALNSSPVIPGDDLTAINAVPPLFAIFDLLIMTVLLVPTILLKIDTDKTKKIGSVLSIFFGVIAASYLLLILINQLKFVGSLNAYVVIYILQFMQVVFLFQAGWREVVVNKSEI